MAMMLAKLFAALRSIGVDEKVAQEAAEEAAGFDVKVAELKGAFADLRSEVRVVQGGMAIIVAVVLGLVWQSMNLTGTVHRLDERMVGFGDRLGAVETRVGAVETRVGALETRVGAVETRLTAVETRLGAVEIRLGAVETGLDAVATRLAGIETILGEIRASILGRSNTDSDPPRVGPENRSELAPRTPAARAGGD
jgi:hypothetical protein